MNRRPSVRPSLGSPSVRPGLGNTKQLTGSIGLEVVVPWTDADVLFPVYVT